MMTDSCSSFRGGLSVTLSLVACGEDCLRRDLLGSGEGTHFRNGGGVAIEESVALVSDTEGVGTLVEVSGELSTTCLVAISFPTNESRLDRLLVGRNNEDELASGRSELSSSTSFSLSEESVESRLSLLRLVASTDIRLSGGGPKSASGACATSRRASIGGGGGANGGLLLSLKVCEL